jgi:hypothetical protein
MGVSLISDDGGNSVFVATYSNADKSRYPLWDEVRINVTNFFTLRSGWSASSLAFVAVTDSSLKTSFFLDNVRLTICYRPDGPERTNQLPALSAGESKLAMLRSLVELDPSDVPPVDPARSAFEAASERRKLR